MLISLLLLFPFSTSISVHEYLSSIRPSLPLSLPTTIPPNLTDDCQKSLATLLETLKISCSWDSYKPLNSLENIKSTLDLALNNLCSNFNCYDPVWDEGKRAQFNCIGEDVESITDFIARYRFGYAGAERNAICNLSQQTKPWQAQFCLSRMFQDINIAKKFIKDKPKCDEACKSGLSDILCNECFKNLNVYFQQQSWRLRNKQDRVDLFVMDLLLGGDGDMEYYDFISRFYRNYWESTCKRVIQ